MIDQTLERHYQLHPVAWPVVDPHTTCSAPWCREPVAAYGQSCARHAPEPSR